MKKLALALIAALAFSAAPAFAISTKKARTAPLQQCVKVDAPIINKDIGVHMLFNNALIIQQYGDGIEGYKAHIDAAVEAGVTSIRLPGDWNALEPYQNNPLEPNQNGGYSQGYLDHLVELVSYAKSKGLDVTMMFAQTPFWARSVPNDGVWSPPADVKEYGEAFAYLAQTLKNAGLTDSIIGWEVWNEPNAQEFWAGSDLRSGTYVLNKTHHAAEYAQLLNAAYASLKQVDTSFKVIGGSIGAADVPYIEALYAAGANFDALAIHPYARVNEQTRLAYGPTDTPNSALDKIWSFQYGINAVRQVMIANGDASKKMHLTEFGWSSDGSWGGGGSEALQAQYIAKALSLIEQMDFVESATVYRLFDNGDHMGLYRANGTKKDAFYAVKNHVKGLVGEDEDIVGTSGNDTLVGTADADRIVAKAGNDNISAGPGNDYLDGGPDDDVMAGGPGNDTFHYTEGHGTDYVSDFSLIDDKVEIVSNSVSNYSELQRIIQQWGPNSALIFSNDDILVLENVETSRLSADMFAFVNQ